ncbi:MAG: hypothetical protein QOC64_886 [Solirubrobacteraceae bacterium]|jgi:hypothetical protein|nr:hypothetical protein [Solirubrobacteraceae bacterium]
METFLIRVWVAPEALEGLPDAPLRGLAQHVRTGMATAFAEGDQLCAWLAQVAQDGRADTAASDGILADGNVTRP